MDLFKASPDEVVMIKTGIERFKEVSFSVQAISSSSKKPKIWKANVRGSEKQKWDTVSGF